MSHEQFQKQSSKRNLELEHLFVNERFGLKELISSNCRHSHCLAKRFDDSLQSKFLDEEGVSILFFFLYNFDENYEPKGLLID
jgi:uncharacterized protein VirK/YbjX